MDKPEHLRPVDPSAGAWLATRPAALVACVLGLASFIAVAVAQGELWATPPWYLSVPGLALTVIATVVSVTRREHGHVLWLIGLGIAAAATVLGWFVLVSIVVIATAILMLILHAVM